MITGALKNRVDRLWTEFWTGGITNPLTVIEQISYLMFIRMLDLAEERRQKQATARGLPFKGTFGPDKQHLRWQNLRNLGAEQLLKVMRDEVFPHLREMVGAESTFGKYMQDANFLIPKASLLVRAMEMINDFPLSKGDTKGDLYEYLLGKLTTAGINGQFRTPRHIIRLMVDLIAPKPTETIGDPACGTGGFLVSVIDYLYQHYTSPEGVIYDEQEGERIPIYSGDLLEPYRTHIQRDMFYGFDFDVTMLRIAAMNMMLHGVENPNIDYQDTLSNSFPERRPAIASDRFDVILANPPFKGSLDAGDVHPSLTAKVKTKKTELLFVALMLRMLKLGGRCAVIVPDGVLFGSSTAHVALRKLLVEDNQLEAVIKLPAGVFKPYAGVSTAILIFTKGGKTENVWFYDVQADGFSLDDKRDKIGSDNDFQDVDDCRRQWAERSVPLNFKESRAHAAAHPEAAQGAVIPRVIGVGKPNPEKFDRKQKAFYVPVEDIEAAKFDLSLNRYKEVIHEEVKYDEPKVIVARLRKAEDEIASDLDELEAMLK